jgi:hypothetical protein
MSQSVLNTHTLLHLLTSEGGTDRPSVATAVAVSGI